MAGKSNKLNMEISDRDKKLLLGLLAVLIVVAAYMFGYKKLTEKAEEYEQEYNEMVVKEADLLEKEADIEEYEASIIVCQNVYNSIIASYGNGITQTFQIDFLNRIERATSVWLKSVNFQSATAIYSFGDIQTSNPSGEGTAYSSDLVGYKTSLTLAYEGQYEDWENFIEYLNTYFSKNVIESISMSYSDITNEVSGSMTLSVYSIVGDDNAYVEPEFDIDTGTENIFTSEALGSVESTDATGDYILSSYDYYMTVSQAAAGIDACTVGRKDDVTGESVLTGNENGTMDLSIELSGTDGSYTISYTLEGSSYTEQCTPGSALELLIISSARTSDDDNVGVDVTIKNNSDIPVNIKVYNDDENAKVNFKSLTGDVVIY